MNPLEPFTRVPRGPVDALMAAYPIDMNTALRIETAFRQIGINLVLARDDADYLPGYIEVGYVFNPGVPL